MKKVFVLICISIFFIGCNMNPSKEARIQKLESEMRESMEIMEQLENRIDSLENNIENSN